MAEAKHEQMLELIGKNAEAMGAGGQGRTRGVPGADFLRQPHGSGRQAQRQTG